VSAGLHEPRGESRRNRADIVSECDEMAQQQRVPLRDVFNMQLQQLTEAEPSVLATDCTPRIDKPYTVLSAWSSFDAEVDKFVQEQTETFPTAMVVDRRELQPDKWSADSFTSAESKVKELFSSQILKMASDALEAMGCSGFAADCPGYPVVGFPDKVWVMVEDLPTVVCFVVKSPWRLKHVTNIIEQSESGYSLPWLFTRFEIFQFFQFLFRKSVSVSRKKSVSTFPNCFSFWLAKVLCSRVSVLLNISVPTGKKKSVLAFQEQICSDFQFCEKNKFLLGNNISVEYFKTKLFSNLQFCETFQFQFLGDKFQF
jgi:hypothetical protein